MARRKQARSEPVAGVPAELFDVRHAVWRSVETDAGWRGATESRLRCRCGGKAMRRWGGLTTGGGYGTTAC